jgi:hypothetical protein
LFGAIGAVVALLAVQGLPIVEGMARGWTEPELSPVRVIGAVLVVAIFAGCGGVVATLIGGATEEKHALAYGLGWQGFLGGYLGSPYRAAHLEQGKKKKPKKKKKSG